MSFLTIYIIKNCQKLQELQRLNKPLFKSLDKLSYNYTIY